MASLSMSWDTIVLLSFSWTPQVTEIMLEVSDGGKTSRNVT